MEFDESPRPSADPGTEPTRERVVRSILENGPSTAAALAERLDLTPAAVRRHLDQLLDDGAVEAARAAQRRPAWPRPSGEGVRADRGRPRPVRPAVRRPRRRRRSGSSPRPAGDDAVREFATRRVAFIEERFEGVRAEHPELGCGRGAGPDLHRRGLRRRGPRRSPVGGGAALPAALPGRPTSPTSSRSCARPRPRRSAGPRPPRPAPGHHRPRRRRLHHLHPEHPDRSRPSTDESTRPTRRSGSADDLHRRAQPGAAGHRPLRVRLGRLRRRRRRPRSAASTRTSCATSPARRASRSGCSTCA